jgi:hypothetical protein
MSLLRSAERISYKKNDKRTHSPLVTQEKITRDLAQNQWQCALKTRTERGLAGPFFMRTKTDELPPPQSLSGSRLRPLPAQPLAPVNDVGRARQ